MKIVIVLNEQVRFNAEVEDLNEFCKSISKSKWLNVGDGIIAVDQIVAILPYTEAPVVAEMGKKE